jgi:hypothetical protein
VAKHEPTSARLIVLTGLALSISGCITAVVTDGHLFQPRGCAAGSYPNAVGGFTIRQERVSVAGDTSLEVIRLEHPQPRALLLYFGGNSLVNCPSILESQTGAAFLSGMADLGVSVLLFNYRGYGNSVGRPEMQTALDDALAMTDVASHKAARAGLPLILHGQSLGSVFATHAAAHRDVTLLILESPPTTVEAIVHQAVPWYAEPFVRLRITPQLRQIDHREMVASVAEPALLIVGSRDEVTPARMAKQLRSHMNGRVQLVVVPGGRHGTLVLSPLYWSKLDEEIDGALQS